MTAERNAKYREELGLDVEFSAAPVEVDSIPPGPEAVDWRTVATDETHPAQTAPKRRGRPPKDPNAPARVPKPRASTRGTSLKEQIGGTLLLMNFAFAFMPDPWRGDALDDVEINLLAEALDDAARANSTIHKYLSTVLVNGGSMANLVMVAAMIGGRRLARHGLMPTEMDDRLGTFLAAKAGQEIPAA